MHGSSRARRLVFGPAAAAAVLVLSLAGAADAASPRVLPEGAVPADRRLGPLTDLDGYFPFAVPETKEAWEARAEQVRRRVLVATGLWPMPERPPVAADVRGTVDRDDYAVAKVVFESYPGLYVTGSLYRPKTVGGPFPAVLCPHGHWPNGRFHDHGPEAVKKEIASGAESSEVGGRYPLQARCVQLARMGCVVFHYDMLGYADSAPLSQDLAHGFKTQRPELSSPDRWGLFSAQSELRQINALGLQTWNSLRALDWIASLPEVDASRIGVTGASGGGTQTFLLGAIDDRPAALFPAVMVSTAMQGGCTCENASHLRVGTGNIELAALAAPRPLGMTAADDWTRELETKGLPELKRLYALLGVPDRVDGRYFPFPHNYNAVSRAMMYGFFNEHLKLGHAGPIVERDYVPLSVEEMNVWDAGHPKPAGGVEAEVALLREIDRRSNEKLASLAPKDAASRSEYRWVVGGAYEVMIGRTAAEAGDVAFESFEPASKPTDDGVEWEFGKLVNVTYGEELPAIAATPSNWNHKVAVWIHVNGKAGLFDDDKPTPAVRKLLDAGYAVVTADLIGQGEFTPDGKPLAQSRKVENPREFAGYTLGYNPSLFAQRVHDVLSLALYAKNHRGQTQEVVLIGSDEAAAWAAAARAVGGPVDRLALAPGDFRFGSITDIRDPNLLPGAVKYGDLPGLLALCAPTPLRLTGGDAPAVLRAAYAATRTPDALTTAEAGADPIDAAVGWVVGLGR